MKLIGNIIWIIFGGLLASLCWLLLGIILCITIIGIPFGTQCFKISSLVLVPFGRDISVKFESHIIMNILWLILFGWELAIGSFIVGLIYCITIVGIPFGTQWFKLGLLSFAPFGAELD